MRLALCLRRIWGSVPSCDLRVASLDLRRMNHPHPPSLFLQRRACAGLYVGMATTTLCTFLLSGLRSPRPRAGVARLTAIPWVPRLPRLPQVLNLSHQAFSLVPHSQRSPSSALPSIWVLWATRRRRVWGTMGMRPNSLSVEPGGRRGHAGWQAVQGIRAAGSGGQRGSSSLYKPGPPDPPPLCCSPLPLRGWEGTGRDADSPEDGEGSTEPVTSPAAVWTSGGTCF